MTVAITESQLLLSNTLNLLLTLLAMNERHATAVTQVQCSHFLELLALKKRKEMLDSCTHQLPELQIVIIHRGKQKCI